MNSMVSGGQSKPAFAAAAAASLAGGSGTSARRLGERAIAAWLFLCGMTSIAFVVLIFLFVFREAFPLFSAYPPAKFFAGKEWTPADDYHPDFGLVPLLLSSLLVTLGAIVLAVPLGVASAVYLAEIAPVRLRTALKSIIELLAAVPSVVLGFFGASVLAPLIQTGFHLPSGVTMLAGSLTLAFMAIPTIATVSDDALRSVPREIRDGSLGLGATRWQTIRHVVLPAAFSGVVASIMLGIGRAVGETMVVLMVTGNGVGGNLTALMNGDGGFFEAFRHVFGAYGELCHTLTATIAAEMGEVVPGDLHYRALFMLGVVLFGITFVINLFADWALRRAARNGGA